MVIFIYFYFFFGNTTEWFIKSSNLVCVCVIFFFSRRFEVISPIFSRMGGYSTWTWSSITRPTCRGSDIATCDTPIWHPASVCALSSSSSVIRMTAWLLVLVSQETWKNRERETLLAPTHSVPLSASFSTHTSIFLYLNLPFSKKLWLIRLCRIMS